MCTCVCPCCPDLKAVKQQESGPVLAAGGLLADSSQCLYGAGCGGGRSGGGIFVVPPWEDLSQDSGEKSCSHIRTLSGMVD